MIGLWRFKCRLGLVDNIRLDRYREGHRNGVARLIVDRRLLIVFFCDDRRNLGADETVTIGFEMRS